MNLRKGMSVWVFGIAVAGLSASLVGGYTPTAMAAQKKAAGGAGDVHAGEELFNTTCMQCHSVNQGQTSFGPNLFHETRKADKKTPAQIREIIEKGKGQMPPLGDRFDEKQKTDLMAYLKTL